MAITSVSCFWLVWKSAGGSLLAVLECGIFRWFLNVKKWM
jgi:hypothetical protein